MPIIKKLNSTVIDQIAAGEVVERPASVVKEMVENAIDAGATEIEVWIEDGGIRSIEVIDNGCGISKDQLHLSVESHATSKLGKSEDLEAIASLGFRGEALASIAAVSRFSITSWPKEQNRAASLKVTFGKKGDVLDAAGAYGTHIKVEDIFAELPARRKFLKKPGTEASHAISWAERLALAHIGIGFKFYSNKKMVFQCAASDSVDQRCAVFFGEKVARDMVFLKKKMPTISLEAKIGPPETARRNAKHVHLYLNGRWVRDARLLRAVREGVREFIPHQFYPVLFLSLEVPPSSVDVNVHPQKSEVRFREEGLVFGSIVRLLRKTLSEASWATRTAGSIGQEMKSNAVNTMGQPTFISQQQVLHSDSAKPITSFEDTLGTQNFLAVRNTFLFREVEGGVEIIDQHALHERVNLEELRKEIKEGDILIQPLLVPSLVELSRAEVLQLDERREDFLKIGVDVSAFGETTLAINGIPARLKRIDPESIVQDLLELLNQTSPLSPEQIQEEMLFSMSCRGAVMAGDTLSEDALRSLLKRGGDLPQDRTCAHGRPVRVFLSYEDLEKAFYRR